MLDGSKNNSTPLIYVSCGEQQMGVFYPVISCITAFTRSLTCGALSLHMKRRCYSRYATYSTVQSRMILFHVRPDLKAAHLNQRPQYSTVMIVVLLGSASRDPTTPFRRDVGQE